MSSQEQKSHTNWKEEIYNVLLDILHRWLLILGVGITTAVAADLILSLTYTPVYTTGATFVMKTTEQMGNSAEIDEIAGSFDYILKSNIFLNQVKKEIGLKRLNGHYASVIIPGTSMIKITATADKPRTAYMMMYAMMDNYMDISQMVIGDTQIEVIERMSAPRKPSNSFSHSRNLLLFGAAGIGIMILLLALWSYTKDTIKGKKDIAEKLQIRMLGSIVKEPKTHFRGFRPVKKKAILITQITTSFWFVEGFKKLRSRIERTAEKKGYQVMMVTSSAENEGKSMVTINLALALADEEKKVLVADMDFRKPAVYKIMDLPKNDALTEVVQEKLSWREALYHDEKSGIDFLLKSEYSENASELLESPVLESMFREMKKEYDYILLDSAPISYMSDAVVLSRSVDGVILTVRQNYMPVTLINRALSKIMVTKTPIIGGVLNRSMKKRSKLLKHSYARYHYREEEQDGR